MRGFLFKSFFPIVFDESRLSESAGAYGSLNPPRSVDWNGCRSPAEMRGFLFRCLFRLDLDDDPVRNAAVSRNRGVWVCRKTPAEMRGFLFRCLLFLFIGKENTRDVFGGGTRAGIEAAFCFFFSGRKIHGLFLAAEHKQALKPPFVSFYWEGKYTGCFWRRDGTIWYTAERIAPHGNQGRRTGAKDAARERRTPCRPWTPHGNKVGFGKHGKHRRAGSPAESRPPPHLPTI